MVGAGGIWRQRVSFSSPGAFKTYANLWEGRNQGVPIQNQGVGRGTGGPWVR
jgi:hypothetical protein